MFVGIDLGTTFSLIARVGANGTPVLFPDRHEAERFSTPSVVHVGPDGALVGQSVEGLLEESPGLPVARFVKLSMGREDPVFVDYRGRGWHPEAVSALILKKLLRDVEAFTDESLEGAVISVPAHFNDAQRQATRHAGLLAGLDVLELVEEPLAAASHYGTHSIPPGHTILVYDLGGGTFDATVLHVGNDGLYALATEGASDLGGKNFDEAIMSAIAEQFRLAHRYDPLQDPIASVQLRRHAEDLKIKLSRPGRGEVHTSLLLGGRTQELHLSRSQFEQLTRPLVDRSLEVCERTLKAAGLDWVAIDQVMMAGGSTLLPSVEAALRRAADKPADRVRRHLPHMAIAYGAALIAARYAGPGAGDSAGVVPGPQHLQRIAAFDLGCRVYDPATHKMTVDTVIARNSPIPSRQTRTYYTNRADQTRIIVEVVQAKSSADEPTHLGYFAFPVERPRKNLPLEVTFGYDEQGMITVVARDPETGHEVKRDFTNTPHPSDRILAQKALLDSVPLAE
jgi:molecular chaperone DnaK